MAEPPQDMTADPGRIRYERAEQLLGELRRAHAGRHEAGRRIPLEIDGRMIGSVEPEVAAFLARRVAALALDDDSLGALPRCAGDVEPVLGAIATALHDDGRIGRWRGESLPVLADDGTMIGVIERAAVRILGIRTVSTHLVACTADGRFWLQRRASNKPVDPGRLDTLAGGLVSAARTPDGRWAMESLAEAMARETLEEAGLEPDRYPRPVHIATERISRPIPEGRLIEDVVVYATEIDNGLRPENRDGEVDGFLCVDAHILLDHIAAGELTVEAALSSLVSLLAPHSPCRLDAATAANGAPPRKPPAGPAR